MKVVVLVVRVIVAMLVARVRSEVFDDGVAVWVEGGGPPVAFFVTVSGFLPCDKNSSKCRSKSLSTFD